MFVLLEYGEAVQRGAVLARAVLAVDHVLLVLCRHKQDVEHLQLKQTQTTKIQNMDFITKEEKASPDDQNRHVLEYGKRNFLREFPSESLIDSVEKINDNVIKMKGSGTLREDERAIGYITEVSDSK